MSLLPDEILLSSNSSIQAIIVSRLILNLKRAGNNRGLSSDESTFRTMTGLDPPIFVADPLLSNIGAPVRMGDFFDEDESRFGTEISQVGEDRDNNKVEKNSDGHCDAEELEDDIRQKREGDVEMNMHMRS